MWQLGAMPMNEKVRAAAEFVIGNLNDDGYLVASDEELMAAARGENIELETTASVESAEVPAIATAAATEETPEHEPVPAFVGSYAGDHGTQAAVAAPPVRVTQNGTASSAASKPKQTEAPFTIEDLRDAIEIVRQMDPIGVAARDLRECLLLQLRNLERQVNNRVVNGDSEVHNQSLSQIHTAIAIVDTQLRNVQNRQFKEIARAIGRPLESVMEALDFLKTLDPKPGQRYNQVEPRLIEPDVAFVKQGDEYVVMMNEDDIPVLRLNPGYKKLLKRLAYILRPSAAPLPTNMCILRRASMSCATSSAKASTDLKAAERR